VPGRTPDWDAQDKQDRELLARGAVEELLAAYVDAVQARCCNRCGAHGEDVAQQVFLRLWRELADGKHRDGDKPFREIVNGVVHFTCKGWEGTILGRDAPLDDHLEPPGGFTDDIADDVAAVIDVGSFVDSLPPGDGEIARLRMLEQREIEDIARETGKTRNAVDQALFRVRREWKRWLES
jgi:DNA-directed RNA polymerase specialized sigma24 family protein